MVHRTSLLVNCLNGLNVHGLGLLIWVSVLFWNPQNVYAQSDGLLQINDATHQFLLQQYAQGRLPNAFLSHQPLSAYEAHQYLDTLALHIEALNTVEQATLKRLRGETPIRLGGNGWLSRRYTNGLDFASVKAEDYSVQVNPLLYVNLGYADRALFDQDRTQLFTWQNTRGLRLSGKFGAHIFFESRLEENQRVVPIPNVQKRTAPRLGNVKYEVDDGSIGLTEPYDYFVGTGMVGFRNKFFELRLGRDRNHWGLGKSSVQLSHYAPAYDQFQIRTTVGKVQYVNLFSGFSDLSSLTNDFALSQTIPRKYGAFHRLSFNPTPRFQFGVFESVIFAPDSVRSGFDFSYLNPVIFYRAVETDRGSAGNAVIGGDFSWVVRPGLQVYSQMILDEFRISEIRKPGRGWWGNKWSWMMGFYMIDPLPFAENLTLRLEYTRTRPFTYSHFISNQGYIHYGDFLAQPAGPNSEDLGIFMTYQPRPRIFVAANFAMTVRGRNTEDVNFGTDPGVSYETRIGEFGHHILQGIPQTHILGEVHGGYEVLPQLYLEVAFQFEHYDDVELGTQWYLSPSAMIRWGLPFQSLRY